MTRLPRGVGAALLAALLFGLSTPFAKLLVAGVSPVLLAGLLYLGSGTGLTALRWLRRRGAHGPPLAAADIPWLAGAVLSGGVAGPVLLMIGLRTTPSSTAALLLNLEAVLTALVAWFVFRENFDRRVALGMGLIVSGGAVLSWQGREGLVLPSGALAVAAACLCWAVDNNLTQKVAAADPMLVASIKGLVAGMANATLGLLLSPTLPSAGMLAAAMLVGLLGYGLSLVLFVIALRHLGTARTGAYFSLAPFIGAGASIPIVAEPVTAGFLVAGALMGAGTWLHLSERHEHEHSHEPLAHDHSHVHDEHHPHEHDPGTETVDPHAHWHVHDPVVHAHHHYPDIHHRHPH